MRYYDPENGGIAKYIIIIGIMIVLFWMTRDRDKNKIPSEEACPSCYSNQTADLIRESN